MAAYQVIEEKGKPKFVVFPFGDKDAVEDYLEELWAKKVVKGLPSRKGEKCFTLEEAEAILSLPPRKKSPTRKTASSNWRTGVASARGKETPALATR